MMLGMVMLRVSLKNSSLFPTDLVMIEVQVGEHTGKDYIVRIEDIKSRN